MRLCVCVCVCVCVVCMLHARMDEYIFRWRMTFDEARGMVIEEYLQGGPEVDADCLVQNVRGW